MKKKDMPLVLAYCCSDESMTSVEIDDEEGGYQMVSYILAQGYRKLGVISGRVDNIHAKRRLLGCQRALFEAGIPYNPSWVLDANWEPEKAYTMTAKLVNAGVDAIFVCQTGWQAVCITVFMIWDLKWERILLLLDLIMRRLQIGTFPR